MIRILSRKALRFFNPNKPLVTRNTRRDSDGNELEFQDIAIPASATAGKTEGKVGDYFFDTKPGEIQEAPEWIRADVADKVNITTFNNAIRSRDLEVLSDVVLADMEKKPVLGMAEDREQFLAPPQGKAASMPVFDNSNPVAGEMPAERPRRGTMNRRA